MEENAVLLISTCQQNFWEETLLRILMRNGTVFLKHGFCHFRQNFGYIEPGKEDNFMKLYIRILRNTSIRLLSILKSLCSKNEKMKIYFYVVWVNY